MVLAIVINGSMDQLAKQMVAGGCRGVGAWVEGVEGVPDYSIMSLSPMVHSFVSPKPAQQRQWKQPGLCCISNKL